MAGTKNKISDLRNHLFEALEQLKDPEKPLDLERAKAICEVSEQIIDTAKVEVSFMEVTGELPTNDFFDIDERASALKRMNNKPNGRLKA